MDRGLANCGPPAVFSALVMGILATMAIILRDLARKVTKTGPTVDHYWIASSIVIYWAYAGVTIWGVLVGGGGLDMHRIVWNDQAGIRIYLKVCE